MNKCNLVKSKRGGHVLVVNGYSYHLNKKYDNKYYWRCTKKQTSGCGVSVITLFDCYEHTFVSQNCDHAHLPEPEKIIDMNFKNKLRTSAKESMDSPSQIVNRCLKDVATISAPQLPNKSACRMIVQRVRNKGLPKIPQTINEFHVPQYLAKSNGKQFLLGQYTCNNESVVIFGTKANVKRMNNAQCWIMDGTFSSCPTPFCQVFSIHVLVGTGGGTNKFLPMVYALLSHKTESCYFIFLEILKRYAINTLNTHLSPANILTDFEVAVINAVK